MQLEVFTKIFHGTNQSAHSAIRSIVQERFFLPLLILPPITSCQLFFWNFGVFPSRIFHSKWSKNIFIDVLLIWFTRNGAHNFSQHTESKIAVFKLKTWCIGKRNSLIDQFDQFLIGIV